jgi:adenine/guanine phosphoribosyltransferase-like PRPP-binding protein
MKETSQDKNIINNFTISINHHNNKNILLYGNNFLFSKRLNEILKRDFSIRELNHRGVLNDHNNFVIDFDQVDTIQGLIKYAKIDTFILTSEILLFLIKENEFNEFYNILSSLKSINIKFIFISILDPLQIFEIKENEYSLSISKNKIDYLSKLSKIKNLFNNESDSIFEFSSFYTFVDSDWQLNPIHIISKNNNRPKLIIDENLHDHFMNLADDLISEISLNITKSGFFKIGNSSLKSKISIFIDEVKNIFNFPINHLQENKELVLDKNEPKTLNYNPNNIITIAHQSCCSVSVIYRKKPKEKISEQSIAIYRKELGASLASIIPKDIKEKLDLIVPVPETGKYYAQGLASKLKIPYGEAFYKKNEIGRSFDINNPNLRKEFIMSKLGLIEDLIAGKNIGIVDEAIFTGATLKIVSDLLKESKVKEVYFFIPSPECKFRCDFNMQPDRSLLSEYVRDTALPAYFDVNGVFFQDKIAFDEILSRSGKHCSKCFEKN